MRALGSLGLVAEDEAGRFSLTDASHLLTGEHPMSLRDVARLEEGPTHYAVWKHLPEIVQDGGPNGFQREFGHDIFEHREADRDYADRFNASMTSLSRMESAQVKGLLAETDLTRFDRICDVGGGHGQLLCTLLDDAPGVEGTVLELPNVVEADDEHWHHRMGLADRVEFVAGDFFEEVPTADAYLMKHILHDWDDQECLEILSTVRQAAPEGARLFICELVVPGPQTPHLAKIFDVNMMIMSTGRERTVEAYDRLLSKGGWALEETHVGDAPMSVVEAKAT